MWDFYYERDCFTPSIAILSPNYAKKSRKVMGESKESRISATLQISNLQLGVAVKS